MASQQRPLLVSLDLKGMVQENKGGSYTNGALWINNKALESEGMRQRVTKKSTGVVLKNKRLPRRSLKKRGRRSSLQGATLRRRKIGIQRKVRTLKRLIPNTNDSMGLDGLFRETADYILSLQSRVRLMQIMVRALAGSDHHQE